MNNFAIIAGITGYTVIAECVGAALMASWHRSGLWPPYRSPAPPTPQPAPAPTTGDLEAFCAMLRQAGAVDDRPWLGYTRQWVADMEHHGYDDEQIVAVSAACFLLTLEHSAARRRRADLMLPVEWRAEA